MFHHKCIFDTKSSKSSSNFATTKMVSHQFRLKNTIGLGTFFLKQNIIYVFSYKPSLHPSPGSNNVTTPLIDATLHPVRFTSKTSLFKVPPSIPISLFGSRFAGKSGELQTYQIVEAPGASGDGGFVPGNMSPPRDPSSLKLVDHHHFSPFGGDVSTRLERSKRVIYHSKIPGKLESRRNQHLLVTSLYHQSHAGQSI